MTFTNHWCIPGQTGAGGLNKAPEPEDVSFISYEYLVLIEPQEANMLGPTLGLYQSKSSLHEMGPFTS